MSAASAHQALAALQLDTRPSAAADVGQAPPLAEEPAAALSECVAASLAAVQPAALAAAIRAALPLVHARDGETYVHNWTLGFANFVDQTPPARLQDAVRWLAVRSASTPEAEFGLLEHALRARAAAALLIHDIEARQQWAVRRGDWQSCCMNGVQEETFAGLMAAFARLEPDAEVDLLHLSHLWVQLPPYLYEPVQQAFIDASDLVHILTHLVQHRPDSLTGGVQLIERCCGRALLRPFISDDFSTRLLIPWLAEARELSPEARAELAQQRDSLAAWLQAPRPASATPLQDFLVERRRGDRLAAGYARLQRPDEGGASELREARLWNSVTALEERVNLSDPARPWQEIQDAVRGSRFTGLDQPNRFGRTHRQKALVALQGLQWDAPDGEVPAAHNEEGLISRFGVAALVWGAIAQIDEPAVRRRLRDDFVMALSRCLDDATEHQDAMPRPNCRRGYAEQLVLLLSGYGLALPCETAYSTARPREMFYEMGAVFHAEIDDETPSVEQAERFHRRAMRACMELLRESHVQQAQGIAAETRKAFVDLKQMCREMSWPLPSATLAQQYGQAAQA